MIEVHPSARVSPGTELKKGVKIGPYAVVEDETLIGTGTVISAHAVVKKYVTIGKNCLIGEHSVLGGLPQDINFNGEESYLKLGDKVTVREFATLHRATGAKECTWIDEDSYIMAYSHVSHNCKIGKNVTIANAVQLAGHVEVGDDAFLGGSTGVHQFTRIGRLAMVGAHSYLTQDLPPFLRGSGHPFYAIGLNTVGLDRAGFSKSTVMLIKRLFRLIYKDVRPRSRALADLTADELATPEIAEFLEFLNATTRGIRLKHKQT